MPGNDPPLPKAERTLPKHFDLEPQAGAQAPKTTRLRNTGNFHQMGIQKLIKFRIPRNNSARDAKKCGCCQSKPAMKHHKNEAHWLAQRHHSFIVHLD